ncbi:hypothetical protein LJC15_05890, partial [Desulfovibrio sp. OttesenSCG-928-G11]|nr:hypothetical protein [Desulfovibrio sp. OttesenSCG-928-G11]
WGESDAVNKVFFVSNGQMSRSNIDENGNTVGWSNTAGAVTGSSANSQQAGYVINENGVKVLGTVNDFQVAVDAFNNFVDQASSLTGSTVDVHALGVTSGYGNNMIGDNLTQYHNQLLSFFDNTGNGNLEADAHVKASANGKDLYLDNWEGVDPGAVASVAGYDLLGKMALAAALNNEYTAMQIDSSGLVEGDGNHIAYLKGGKLEVTFGDGDDIVYAGGSGTINLGDGDNYVNTAYYQSVNITSGDGDNYAHINNCGAKVAFGEGADTVMLAGGFNNTINVGGGDDLVVVHNRGNVITLGDGNDTVELNWMIANNDKLEAGSTTKVVAMATNTITDFTVGEDVLNIGNLIGNDQSLDDYLKDYAKLELDDGGNLRITFSHSGEEQGYYRGNGGEQGWNYNVSAGQVATSEVVLQNFTANNSQFSNADLTSNDLSADEQALHTLMQILGSSG